MHFEGESAVHKTLRRLVARLDELGIDYAIAGGMALFFHGYRRFTEDIDVLVTPEGLARIHQELEGLGYVKPFEASKNLRDAVTNVKIDFLQTGSYPGEGKPGPISFPDPKEVATEIDGIRFVGLSHLVELKLASGKAPGRRKDHADVQELIRLLDLPDDWGQRIDPSLRDLFSQLWIEVRQTLDNE